MNIATGNSNIELAKKIAKNLNQELIDIKPEYFSSGEIFINNQYKEIINKDFIVIQSISSPVNDNLMEAFFIIDLLKKQGARTVTALIPYFAYGRQDKNTKKNHIAAKLIAKMFETAGADKIITLDLHSKNIEGFFNIPVINIDMSYVIINDLSKINLNNHVIVSPDIGGIERAKKISKLLNLELVIIHKCRDNAKLPQIFGEVNNKKCIIIDDIIDSAYTLSQTATSLKKQGAVDVKAYITHGVLSNINKKHQELDFISELIVTDSMNILDNIKLISNIRILSIAEHMAEAIKKFTK